MRRLLLLALLGLAPALAFAQTTPAPQRVVLVDGRVLVGTVVENADGTLTITDASGVVTTVPRAQVRRFAPPVAGGFVRNDPAGSRMFITPTGTTIPQGQRRLSTFLVVLPSLSMGVTDRVDASIYATIPVSAAGVAGVNVKANVLRAPSLNAAVGVTGAVVYGADRETPYGGTVYAVTTFGNDARNVTVGAYGLYGGADGSFEFADGGFGASLSGSVQVSNSLKLMSENVLGIPLDSGGEVVSAHLLGARFFGENISGDLAFAFGQSDGDFEFSPIPYVGFSYNF